MSLTTLLAFVAVLAAPSLGQSWLGRNPSGGRGDNSYINGLVGNINNRREGNDCYNRCYDAWQVNPSSYYVSGCVCSTYDFSNRGQGGRRVGGRRVDDRFGGQTGANNCYDQCYDAWEVNPNSYHIRGCVCSKYDFNTRGRAGGRVSGQTGRNSCYSKCYDAWEINPNSYQISGCVCSNYNFNSGSHSGRRVGGGRTGACAAVTCPIGTICEERFGAVSCKPRDNVRNGGGSYNRNGSGRGNGQCGYLRSNCQANAGDYNTIYRYTYDYNRQTCIKIRVQRSCAFSYGASNNLFKTYDDCYAQCSTTRTY